MPLGAMKARAAECHTLQDVAVVADLRRLADDNAHAVVDEQAFAYRRAGMDLDARDEAAEVGDRAGDDGQAGLVKSVRHAVQLAGVEAGIRKHDFDSAAGGRVALANGAYVTVD
jgi:hypothetical protein